MDDALKAKLLTVFPAAAVEIGELYAPAIARMGLKELLAMDDFIRAKELAKAREAIRAAMTVDELAAEAEALVPLDRKMAEEQAEAVSIGKSILMAGLKAAFAIAIGMVGL